MKALRIILMTLAFISLQAHAKDGRNLAVNQANKVVSEQRIALVIGNSKYNEKPLANPADARVVVDYRQPYGRIGRTAHKGAITEAHCAE